MSNRIKYILHPAFTDSQWLQRNPTLLDGEIAVIKNPDTGLSSGFKIGPGKYSDLELQSGNYPYTDAVTNEIGDAKGVLSGMSPSEILHLMLNPYKVPQISVSRNNGGIVGGSFANTQVKEIGVALSGPLLVQFNVSDASNLEGATPIILDSNGAFNDGSFANGQISLTPSVTINPTLTQTFEIDIQAQHKNGLTNVDKTYLKWWPRLIWGSSDLSDLSSGADVMALLSKGSILRDNINYDYQFSRQGYHWICIPGMLDPTNPKFTDITDPNAPGNVAFVSKGSVTVNNGVGTYVYQLFRSPFYITESVSKYRVVNG